MVNETRFSGVYGTMSMSDVMATMGPYKIEDGRWAERAMRIAARFKNYSRNNLPPRPIDIQYETHSDGRIDKITLVVASDVGGVDGGANGYVELPTGKVIVVGKTESATALIPRPNRRLELFDHYREQAPEFIKRI